MVETRALARTSAHCTSESLRKKVDYLVMPKSACKVERGQKPKSLVEASSVVESRIIRYFTVLVKLNAAA